MKSSSFIIFFLIVISIYTLAHVYLYVRGIQAFSPQGTVKKWSVIGYIALASLFMIGMFLERTYSSVFSEWILKIGSTWLAFLLYFILTIVVIDIVRVLNYFFQFLPQFTHHAKVLLGISVFVFVGIVVLVGHITALRVQVVQIPITIHKSVQGTKHIKILMASDLHLGAIIGESWEQKFLKIGLIH